MGQTGIAVLGVELIGRRHVEIAGRHASIVAIVDPTPNARALAHDLGVSYHQDLASLLASPPPDGVIVATPNDLHAQHAIACIEAGLPVLVEKPLADTKENACRIAEASARRGVPVLVGHHRRHSPIIAAAKAEIDRGTLGDIVSVQGQFWLYKPPEYFEAEWRQRPGGGPVMINAIHDIDTLRHLCGDIVEVTAMRANAARGNAVEDTAVALLRFASGALGTLNISDSIGGPWSWEMTSSENPVYPHHQGTCYHIGGTKASLAVLEMTLWRHPGTQSWWHPIESRRIATGAGDAIERQFLHFLDVIDGKPPLIDAVEGLRSLEVTLKILDAALLPGNGASG